MLVGTCVFLYPQVAAWFSQREQSLVTSLAMEAMDRPPNSDETFRAEEMAKARQYNDELASGAVYAANANIAVGQETATTDGVAYDDLLNTSGEGFMGRLLYEDLAIDLPIYHGTSDEILEHGVGHLEGTSLPVGGVGTRSVLTAHRGLPSATLFTNLDKAEMGDTFTVSVLDEVLTYKVVEIQVIKPEETQEIVADPDRDLITLVTCTPLGINSHRILVTAERITPTPIGDIESAAAEPNLPGFPWWTVVLGTVLVLFVVYIWRSGYQAPPAKKSKWNATNDGPTDDSKGEIPQKVGV
ncbi:class C sortase [Gulosibacter chungangensis]|uniref:Class C sortase n=1 Tax=Gulosibacter chungangensis TaxID=979746 RepID=A0A7J5BGA5_9MICO|nr:class C sortase [Gulosibacter chungangensis]